MVNKHTEKSVRKANEEDEWSIRNEDFIRMKSIPRVDSEFSLGLNRSDSIGMHLSEYGELCQSGQWAVLGLKSVGITVVGYLAISKAYDLWLKSSQQE